uniref:ZP domain-containing protein n=1 Tax=Strongyloides papillosus TaxID=174720 RepID=A0A0N5BY95_STREA
MRWRTLSSNSVILVISIITYIITQIKGLSYRCENDQILIVQSFGNDTIRMHCQKLQLCGYSNLKCTYDKEQPACGGKTNFVAHVNQLTPTGKVVHTCCDMTFKDNENKPMIEHDGNDCFVYELPDGTTDTTPGSDPSDIIKKNIEVVRNGFTVLKDASQIPEDFGGYTGYRLRLFMLRNKSPPLLIVKAIERTSGGYRVTICRPRCGKFNREGLISHGDSISTFDKDILVPKNKLTKSNEEKIKLYKESEENQTTINSSKGDLSLEENENKSSSKSSSETHTSSSKVSSELEKEYVGNNGFYSKESSSSGPKSGHVESFGKNGEWTAASWTSWSSNTWTTWSTQTWNSWNEHEKNKDKNVNTRIRGQTRGDRVVSSDLNKKIIDEVTKDLKYKGTDINDYDNLNSHETHEMESREKGFIDNRKVVIINHNSTTFNNYIHHGEKDTSEGRKNYPLQINNNNSFGNVSSSSNNSAKNKMPNGVSQVNHNGGFEKSDEDGEKNTNDGDSVDNNGDSFHPLYGKKDKIPFEKNNKNAEDDSDENDKSKNDKNDFDNNDGDLADKIRSFTKKPYKNRSGKKDDQNNSKELSAEKNNEDDGDDVSGKGKKNGSNKKGNKNDKKNKDNINEEKNDKSDEKLTDDGDDNNKPIDQNNRKDDKNNASKKKKNDKNKNNKDNKNTTSPRHPENEGDEAGVDGDNDSGKKKSTKNPESENLEITEIVNENSNEKTGIEDKNSGDNKLPGRNDKNKLNNKPNKNTLTDKLKTDNEEGDNKENSLKSNKENLSKEKGGINNNKKPLTSSNDKTKNNNGDQTLNSSNITPGGIITNTPNNKNDNGIESSIPEGDGDNNKNKTDINEESKEIGEESEENDGDNLPSTTTVIDTDNGNENINNEKDIFGDKNDKDKNNKQPTDALSGSGSLINKEDNFGTHITTINEKTNSSREEIGESTAIPSDLTENGNTPFNLGGSGEEGNKLRGSPNDNTNVSGENGSSENPDTSSGGRNNEGNNSEGNNNGSGDNSNGGTSGEEDGTENNGSLKSRSNPLRQSPKVAGSPTHRASGGSSAKAADGNSEPPSAFNAVARRNCFAGDTIIETPGGSKRMDELQVGDLVLVPSPEGIQKFEKVEMFYHRKPDYEQKFLLIQTESGKKLSLTELHLIPFGKCSDANNAIRNNDNLQQWMLGSRYAYKVKEGECVISYDDNNHLIADKIIKVGRKISKGIYSPITTEGGIVTDGIFTSCFSQIESQATQKLAYDIITMFYRAFGYLSDNTQQIIQEIPSSVDMLHQLSWYIIPFAKY